MVMVSARAWFLMRPCHFPGGMSTVAGILVQTRVQEWRDPDRGSHTLDTFEISGARVGHSYARNDELFWGRPERRH